MKIQIQIIAIILILPVCGLSQNKFSVGVNVNSQISFMTIKNSHSYGGMEEKVGQGFGYSLGIQTQYGLNEKMFLRSGLNYQNRNNRHIIEGLKFGADILNAGIQNDITISSMGIPIDFGYYIKTTKERVNFLIGFGGLLNVNLNTKTKAKIFYAQLDDEEIFEAENVVEEAFYSLGIFGGIEMQISNKLILGIEPNLRFTPNKFILYPFNSDARTTFETGLTIRIRMK